MTTVVFYEKPGCQGNARQKALLTAAGHTVEAKNLKAERWTRDRLLDFLAPLPVAEWFNRSAPAVKSGEIVPEQLSLETALPLLLGNPLLVRRPLLEVDRGHGPERRVGFDAAAVDAWIGLNGAALPAGNLEACVHGEGGGHQCGGHDHDHAHDAEGCGDGSQHGRCGGH